LRRRCPASASGIDAHPRRFADNLHGDEDPARRRAGFTLWPPQSPFPGMKRRRASPSLEQNPTMLCPLAR
jgi:hypothetical protein